MGDRIQPGRITKTHAYFWNSLYSQWYTTKNQFTENGVTYPNAEKYMMCMKAEVFGAHEILFQMLETDNPRIVKALGRKIENFTDEIWDKHKIDIVRQANYLKFTQNPDLMRIMFEHQDLILVEASPQDPVWGIGLHFDDDDVLEESKWKGQNLLGECIMFARNRIIEDQKYHHKTSTEA